MKLLGIQIEKFRSIEKCYIHLNETNAIVGENNAGKTAILRALNSVFNYEYEEKYFKDNTHQFAIRNNTKITLTFNDVPDKEIYSTKINSEKLILVFSFAYSNNKKTMYCSIPQGKVPVDDDFIKLLKQDIDYVYVPASRSNRDLAWTENSIFKRLITLFTQQYTQNRDNISKRVQSVADVLHSTILTKIEKEISSLNMLGDSGNYKLDYMSSIDYTIFLNKLGIKIIDHGREFPVAECGSGIKSLTVIALYRTLAKKENTNIILGIEEPETNLHPQAQKKLIASLKSNRQEHEVQSIFATHSTVIVDELNHEDIILVRRINNSDRGFVSTVSQLDNNFWEMHNIGEFKHYDFFKYRNSDFFFSKHVIVVESTTDAQVVEKLISPKLKDDFYYVSILNLNGVKNLKYPYFLLKDLHIPFSIVVDRDFFTPYLHDRLADSRADNTGLPQYANRIDDRNPVINAIFTDATQKEKLRSIFEKSYSVSYDYLKQFKIYSMQYCLEMDLTCSKKARDEYYRILNIPIDERNQKSLLISSKKNIKNPENIFKVLENISIVEYPISYKKIKNALIADVQSTISSV